MSAGPRSRPVRAGLLGFVAAIALAASQAAVAPTLVAAASSSLTFISQSTWVPQPSQSKVHVSLDVDATAHTADTSTRRFFFNDLPITVPGSTANYTATAGSAHLPVKVVGTSGSGIQLLVSFPVKLYNTQSYSFQLDFDLVDKSTEPRRDLRIGKNVMSFPVYAFGSPATSGSSSVVIFPPGYAVQQEFGTLNGSTDNIGASIYRSGPVADPSDVQAWFTAEEPVQPSDFLDRSMTVGTMPITLRYWADDPGWADQVGRVLKSGFPLLESAIGMPPATANGLTIEEASSQSTGGYDGVYDPSSGKAQVSYLADPFVILHETAHLWFNSAMASDRWIDEAFASYYADQVVTQLRLDHREQQLTDKLRQSAIALNDWVAAGDPNSPQEAYAYAATLEVGKAVGSAAGPDVMRKVWQTIRSGAAPYQPVHGGAPEERPAAAAPDWRSLLDYFDEVGGKSFEPIWRQWVVDGDQARLLDQRDAARTAYRNLLVAAGTWDVPPDVRRAMDSWQFDDAKTLMNQATTVLGLRGDITRRAAVEETTPPASLRQLFETRSVAAAGNEAAAELAALDSLSSARLAESLARGAARDLGLLGADPAAQLVSARQAFAAGDLSTAASLADEARATWEGANEAGGLRIVGVALIVVGLLLLFFLGFWLRRRLVRGRRLAFATAAVPSGVGRADGAAPLAPRNGAAEANGDTDEAPLDPPEAAQSGAQRDGDEGPVPSEPAASAAVRDDAVEGVK